MHIMFVGIDLGWTTGRTGLAAVEGDGVFVDSTTVTSDDEIVEWVGALPGKVVVAAVDAPLIVTNLTGQREAERSITAAFGAYKAGAHTTNLAKAGMNPPRAALLADRLGWTKTARQGSVEEPACIEVYPHPAMVSLFDLTERLAYKDKRQFTLEDRQDGFARLLDHLEAIDVLALAQSARWGELRLVVESARTRADLNRVEDELDAVLCAHLAWLWHTKPDLLDVYGNPTTGYIVAPPPPTRSPDRLKRLVVDVDAAALERVREVLQGLEGVRSVR